MAESNGIQSVAPSVTAVKSSGGEEWGREVRKGPGKRLDSQERARWRGERGREAVLHTSC